MAKRKQHDDDDGRVISPMNVDGMPWYVANRPQRETEDGEKLHLTREEQRAYAGGIFKAVLLVSSVFILAFTVFILFCVFVWFN